MLLSVHPHASAEESIGSIHNYYENLVIEEARQSSSRAMNDLEFLADVACVSLNHLPPRYIRHDVDMTFFLSPAEQQEMLDKVKKAVAYAIQYVSERDQSTLSDHPTESVSTASSDPSPTDVNNSEESTQEKD
ncbi:late competence development ComFB family protein [Marinibactrum halimedae]|uniref:Competence protein ComFB n=1 Tax=Marinibactrum halimedae TaxID=1444977 RepID=A0AA37T9J3_9GAMM|nr:late competence development ComFB family protein [Marinibactrum halimedae]MCD9458615.1 late competence development ComFB family protein [Marinibactrum halimedae]GLS26020.1 hypothetical protein GCM10007877_17350 [Marinibactrum halimedae]